MVEESSHLFFIALHIWGVCVCVLEGVGFKEGLEIFSFLSCFKNPF